MNQHQGHLMSLGDQKLLYSNCWHWLPDTLTLIPLLSYTQISETCSTLDLCLRISWFCCLPGWKPTETVTLGTPSACSLSHHPCPTLLYTPQQFNPLAEYTLLSGRTKWHLSQFCLPVSPESSHFFPTPPTHIRATHLFPGWLQLVSCLCSFPHPSKESFLKGRSDHVTSLYKKLQWLIVTVWIKTKPLHS